MVFTPNEGRYEDGRLMGNCKGNHMVASLVGAQYGSEGKGVVAYHLADEFDVWVRTGGPNAGHSIVHEGVLYKMQCLPCGWVNPEAKLVLGAGAVINPNILLREIEMIEKVDPNIRERIFIDFNATPLLEKHIDREGHTRGEIHARIGSTGEGVGAARADWLNRNNGETVSFYEVVGDIESKHKIDEMMCDTEDMLHDWMLDDDTVMLEGTQGCGLSLVHGDWPYVTSADTNTAQLCVDAGIAPSEIDEVWLVARTYPIRVGGNSGPLRNETDWGAMSKLVGEEVEERTTVTKKVRRVGAWDEEAVAKACRLNRPTHMALTFMDYLSPEDKGKTEWEDLSPKAQSFVDYVQRTFGVYVGLIGTGFDERMGWTCVARVD